MEGKSRDRTFARVSGRGGHRDPDAMAALAPSAYPHMPITHMRITHTSIRMCLPGSCFRTLSHMPMRWRSPRHHIRIFTRLIHEVRVAGPSRRCGAYNPWCHSNAYEITYPAFQIYANTRPISRCAYETELAPSSYPARRAIFHHSPPPTCSLPPHLTLLSRYLIWIDNGSPFSPPLAPSPILPPFRPSPPRTRESRRRNLRGGRRELWDGGVELGGRVSERD